MTERRNRLKLALPLYGSVPGTFLQHWIGFGGQVARYDKYAGLTTTQRPYVDIAMNEIIAGLLKESNWDYLFNIEQDMVMPDGLMDRLARLDPETHPIVSCLYFGRVQEDQRPVCGFMRDGIFNRLSYEEVCPMLPERGGVAGFHRVDVVGMGATAIHRSVFENWGFTPRRPWFRTDYDDLGPLGHDVYFCTEAAKLGYPIHVDSSMIADHLGEWRSNNVTYLATTEHAHSVQTARWTSPPTMMTDDELTYLAQLADGKRVLEIGSQYGNSTVAMARTAKQVVAVDWFVGDGHAGEMNASATRHIYFSHLERAGVVDRVVTMATRWEDALDHLRGPFDLIFIDAFHSQEATSDLLLAIEPLLAQGGLIAAHDYGRFGVKPAVDLFQDGRGDDLAVVDTLAVVGFDIPAPDLTPRIVVPVVVNARPETMKALIDSGHPFVEWSVGKSDDAYYQLIAGLWRNGHTFITVEQDIVPTKSQLDDLVSCGEPWCAFAYEYPPFGLYAGMGLARFSAGLLRAEPRAMEITGAWRDDKHPPMHWCRVDGWLKAHLMERGYTQHIHGQVEHLHRGRPAHDCTTPEEAEAILAAQRA
jgi:predicted O-methyltransferase YrrM